MTRTTAWLAKLALLGLSFSLVLAAGECVLRLAQPQTLSIWDNLRDGMTVHWPGLDVYLPRYGQRIRTNSIGMRDREHASEKPAESERILVFGDSFMEAIQVPFEESFPAMLEAELDEAADRPIEIVNLSVSGWGTDDEVTYLERHAGGLGADGILIMMTLHNDIADNALLEFHTLEDGELVARPIERMPFSRYAVQKLKAYLAGHSNLYQLAYQTSVRGQVVAGAKQLDRHVATLLRRSPPPEIDAGWALTFALLDKALALARERDAWLAVGLIPLWVQVDDDAWKGLLTDHGLGEASMQRTAPQQRVQAWADSRGVLLVDLLPDFAARNSARDRANDAPLYLPQDGHWSASGHALAAEVVAARLISARRDPRAAR